MNFFLKLKGKKKKNWQICAHTYKKIIIIPLLKFKKHFSFIRYILIIALVC